MEEENPKKSFPIWMFLIPAFILAAWPALKWLQKANSNTLELSNEEYSAFNTNEGETRPSDLPAAPRPELNDGVLNVRYKSKAQKERYEQTAAAERAEMQKAAREAEAARAQQAAARQNPQKTGQVPSGAPDMSTLKTREQQSVGFTKGLMTSVIKSTINNPKALGAVLNNKNVISGFMARDTVKSATGSLQGLQNYLKSGGPANFINNPLVKAAMANPAVISALASSGLAEAMLNTPAAKELMNNPQAIGELITSNPELVNMVMSNPNNMAMLMSNPDVSNKLNNFDLGAIKRKQ